MTIIDEATNLMMDFKLWEAMQTLYSGMVGTWWAFPIYMALVFVVGIVTRSLEAVAAFTAMSSVILIYYDVLPLYYEYISYLLVTVSIAVLLYRFFGPSER